MSWFESLVEWLKSIFLDLVEFITYIPIEIIDGILSAISSLILSIPLPDFILTGFQDVINGFPDSLLWIMSVTGFPEALAIFGSGVAFRLLRKLFTLGQW